MLYTVAAIAVVFAVVLYTAQAAVGYWQLWRHRQFFGKARRFMDEAGEFLPDDGDLLAMGAGIATRAQARIRYEWAWARSLDELEGLLHDGFNIVFCTILPELGRGYAEETWKFEDPEKHMLALCRKEWLAGTVDDEDDADEVPDNPPPVHF